MIADRHAMVMDFGVAKAMKRCKRTSGLTSIGISLGTPAVHGAGQAGRRSVISSNHRADIYSIGGARLQMLVGTPPFVGTPQAVLMAQIANLRRRSCNSSPGAAGDCSIVMKCLEKDAGESLPDSR